MLAGKTTFAFDWDGTVLDSMKVKERTFSTSLAQMLDPLVKTPSPDLAGELRARYRALSGAPRRVIVETILSERGIPFEAMDFDSFGRRLGELNRRELATANLFPDAIDFLTRLVDQERAAYISSSVPGEELRPIVASRLPRTLLQRLRGVFGSDGAFTKGPAHVARILRETAVPPRELLCFGDDPADARLCQSAGVDCVLIDRDARLAGVDVAAPRISSFAELTAGLGAPSQA
jgi:phosphoglycolate phosphatase-like HAD superfamily hydrolase